MIWPILYGPYIIWGRGCEPSQPQSEGFIWNKCQVQNNFRTKMSESSESKMHNPRMGVPEIKNISIYE